MNQNRAGNVTCSDSYARMVMAPMGLVLKQLLQTAVVHMLRLKGAASLLPEDALRHRSNSLNSGGRYSEEYGFIEPYLKITFDFSKGSFGLDY